MTRRLAGMFARLHQESVVGLIGYVPVGYPNLALTPAVVEAMVEGGADAIELGIPFSDPVADGRSIQRATFAALRAGASVPASLEAAARCRQRTEAPLVFSTYYNPVLAYGSARFTQEAARVGADAVIVADLPASEGGPWCEHARAAGLDTVFLVAPTSSEERIDAAARASTGFLYCVALTGITGARAALGPETLALLARARACTALPLAAGFGISRAEHVRALRGHAQAAFVGSAVVDAIAAAEERGAPAAAGALIAQLKAGGRG